MTSSLSKGPSMEEALRFYFIRNGYYTLRAVPFVYRGFDVTNIDIWLYDRPSAVSRQRIIVDAKNRKTPQALERIFWTLGLSAALGVEQAIVATTDKRPAVFEFGKSKNVVVFDGAFCARLLANPEILRQRLSEEEFTKLIDSYALGKLSGNWKERMTASKAMILDGLDYNAVNRWLGEAKFFAEQTLLVPTYKEVGCRILYLLVSFVAIAMDFLMKDLAFAEAGVKLAAVNNGLRYGTEGEEGTQRVVNLAVGLVEQYATGQRGIGQRIKSALAKDLDSIKTGMLAEYLARQNVTQDLFATAKALESAAYARRFTALDELPATGRALIGVLLDFWEVDRVRFYGNLPAAEPANADGDQSETATKS